ncbi:DNA primase [Oceanibacterium hippocampi]|uniref:DNA primase n=1 Tax=Oceanibacterium hippocampi TaxID=745714 RepID=A0A1Y5TVH5_9PROT|nr:DNA primase [Oceanibacterium hippocampi]SLN74240.1 DNA primase [Oceanibacterium hippocampi]
MSVPASFLDELRERTSITAIVGRRVKLIRQGRRMVGLCPFHNEKSPSFGVNEERGFYHCFGCGVHGDALDFLREQDGLSFIEAVRQLAADAGMTVPEESPEAHARREKAAGLHEVLEAAAAWFESQLKGEAGGRARDYLSGRGVGQASIARFRLGLAPGRRRALAEALAARNITEEQMVEAGLIARPEGGGEAFDRFRDRLIFPITDRQGRVIAFGGRALGEARAKYLNSPETPLFHKGRALYNLAGAREAVRAAGTVLVAEGYMDVIALSQAGFAHAVAPLGTAVTEEQIELLWRMAPEPIICLDGDQAGLNAAVRTAERALPLLKPGHSLRFAILPEGQDPDDLIRAGGPPAMQAVLDAALPFAELLWRKATGDRDLDTPERRAALRQELFQLAGSIRDATVQGYYQEEFRRRLSEAFDWRRQSDRRDRGGQGDYRRGAERPRPRPGLGPTRMPETGARREVQLLATLLTHPELIERYLEELAEIEFERPELDRLRVGIIDIASFCPGLDSQKLKSQLAVGGHDTIAKRLLGGELGAVEWFAMAEAHLDDAERGWKHVLARHRRDGLLAELRVAEAELAENMTDETLGRFLAVKRRLEAAEGSEAELEGFGRASGREERP